MSRLLAVAVAALLVAAAPASAQTTVKGVDGPGPSRYDKVRVVKSGPASAKRVLVIVPGTSASAGNTAQIGADIAQRLKGWQVWSVARRETLLEDHATFERAMRGEVSPAQVFDYYLGWLAELAGHRPREDPRGRRRGVRAEVGDGDGDRGPAPRRGEGAGGREAEGRAGRALARRDDRGGVRDVGLRRARGGARPRGPGADRRRLGPHAAEDARRGAQGRQGAGDRLAVPRPERQRRPVEPGRVRGARRHAVAHRADGARAADGVPVAAGLAACAGARHQPRRLRVRRRLGDQPAGARPRARPRGPPGGVGRPARLGRRRADPDRPRREPVHRRHFVVPPAPPVARRLGGQRRR